MIVDTLAIDDPSYPSSPVVAIELKSVVDVSNEPSGWLIAAREREDEWIVHFQWIISITLDTEFLCDRFT